MGLSSHPNVDNTCLRLLLAKGFALEVRGKIEPDGSHPTECHWIARKEGFVFCGDNPIELLGLTAIYEHLEPLEDKSYWWVIEGPDIRTQLLDSALPFETEE